MATNRAPTRPRNMDKFVQREGPLDEYGLQLLESMWRQYAPGHVIVPVAITQVSVNVLVMLPEMHEEGAHSYGNGMTWFGKATATSAGAVTGYLTTRTKALDAVKIYINNGASQAGAGDITLNRYYHFVYHADLDGGLGGLIRY